MFSEKDGEKFLTSLQSFKKCYEAFLQASKMELFAKIVNGFQALQSAVMKYSYS